MKTEKRQLRLEDKVRKREGGGAEGQGREKRRKAGDAGKR